MSDRIDGRAGRQAAPFASVVARERGRGSTLVPRLPTIFEDAPAGDDPGSLVADRAVSVPRAVTRVAEPTGSSDVARGPERVQGAAEVDRGARGRDVVRVEREVLVETIVSRTPAHTGDDRTRSPRTDSSTPDDGSAPIRWPSPGDRDPGQGPPSAPRPLEEEPPLRPAGSEPVVVQDRVRLDDDAGPDPRRVPVVATRREVLAPRREQPPDHAAPSAPAESVVHVSIGRLEIRAVPGVAPARSGQRPARRIESLDDYLERRNQGRGP